MAKICFRTSKKWNTTKVTQYNAEETHNESITLKNCDDGGLSFDFDTEKYDHLQFENENGEKALKVYPGRLSIGVEYKKNDNLKREATYLFCKGNNRTGRVDNYVIKDEKNLSHRQDKSKKISVFVPSSYDDTPHDILYFFDAQNLFGSAGDYTENGDPYGSWQIDVVISALHRQYKKNIIVVGIDNADKYRDKELFMDPASFGKLAPLATALPDEDYSHGHLDGLADFIINTLHPFIKEKYCVSDNNIGIGGSSMGGIASFYCGLRNVEFYKYILSYSPAFALYEMSAFDNWFTKNQFNEYKDSLPKIHIYCGEGDPLERLLVGTSRDMKPLLVKYGYPENKVFETYDLEKPHNEESWRLILPQSFEYLL